MSAALAEFLVDGAFLSEWCAAAGQLPPRSTATLAQDDDNVRALIRQVVTVAGVYPSSDVTAVVNPVLAQAFLQVFKLQIEPDVAAQQAVEALNPPK